LSVFPCEECAFHSPQEQARRSLEEIVYCKEGKLTFKSNKFELSSDSLYSKYVKHIRENILHVSQKVVAESIGVSVRTVQGWEIGKSKPAGAARKLHLLMVDIPELRAAVLAQSD
jgi:DNA-binding transcriptional regulator YiaG